MPIQTNDRISNGTHFLVDAVLIYGPNCGHVRVEQLGKGDLLVASPGADEPRLADGRVADHHTFHQFLI